jgi:hypothetical protein
LYDRFPALETREKNTKQVWRKEFQTFERTFFARKNATQTSGGRDDLVDCGRIHGYGTQNKETRVAGVGREASTTDSCFCFCFCFCFYQRLVLMYFVFVVFVVWIHAHWY